MIGTGAHVINGYVDLKQSILYLLSQKGSVMQRSGTWLKHPRNSVPFH
jgi:hypothetical protein